MTADRESKADPALVGMLACYLSRSRVAWPYLALLFGAMAFLLGALFLPA